MNHTEFIPFDGTQRKPFVQVAARSTTDSSKPPAEPNDEVFDWLTDSLD